MHHLRNPDTKNGKYLWNKKCFLLQVRYVKFLTIAGSSCRHFDLLSRLCELRAFWGRCLPRIISALVKLLVSLMPIRNCHTPPFRSILSCEIYSNYRFESTLPSSLGGRERKISSKLKHICVIVIRDEARKRKWRRGKI